MATLGGRRVTDLELTIPPAGAWLCTGHLDSGDPVAAGAVTLTIGDLAIQGRILPGRGGTDAPAHPAFVLAGGAGWKTPLPAPGGSYASAAGVRLTTVLRDLAAIAGELYLAPPEVSLGASYGWDVSTPQQPRDCGEVLADLVARRALPLWRVACGARDVAPNGRTVFAPWPSWGPADAHGVIRGRDLGRGVWHVALSNSVAAWLPGATVQGRTIARVTLTERDGELRARISDA